MAELTEQEQKEVNTALAKYDIEKANTLPNNLFAKKDEPVDKTPIVSPDADKLVNVAVNQAIVATISNDKDLQGTILDTAHKYTATKMEIIKNTVNTEDKKAYFDNKKSACQCFGYDEDTTEKWAVKYMNVWHNLMTAIWITLGWVTFAPITFIGKKLGVIIKQTWLAIMIAILLYLGITFVPILIAVLPH